MKYFTILLLLPFLTTTGVHSSTTITIDSRQSTTDPIITTFHSFADPDCNDQGWSTGYTLSLSQATRDCLGLYESRSLSVGFLDARCQVTIYTEQGCKDPGVVMGVGGYFSDGEKGLKGYRVDCPWW
ncbi:hypothetical protein B0H65DRAFT_469479 [Neurospora tetraspora]|uniref:Ecp2 effector protein domain-containing protein n=1 Tax=Neurospora tetraspora TaxID=94610 RepID=A0AAE0JCT7_9PEZI|nr:hypothetical protein B0H65DRAFT_469479 [Neurospora tetraspora]